MTDTRRLFAKIGLGLILGILAGCGSEDDTSPRGLKPAAAIIIDGSSTVFAISNAAREDFRNVNGDVTVVVDQRGTVGGFGRYLQGEVDIVDASRPAEPDEEARAKAQGIEWTPFVVGYDRITSADKTYAPLSRALFIYVKNSAIGRPEIAQFLRYYLDHLEELATKLNYDPVTAADKTANQQALAKLLSRGETEAKSIANLQPRRDH